MASMSTIHCRMLPSVRVIEHMEADSERGGFNGEIQESNLKRKLAELEIENAKLKKINKVLIQRVDMGWGNSSNAYHSFENAVLLTDKVKQRTMKLQSALSKLEQEISERKAIEIALRQAKREAEKANQSKTKYMAAISHDLLQPINAARLFASALKEICETKKSRDLSGSLMFSLENMDALLTSLVDISKLDAGVVNSVPESFPINELLENLAKECRTRANQAELEFNYINSSVIVHTDSILLARILRNFISNAIRYTKKGKITLGCRRRPDGLEIQVLDTGEGIAPDKLAEIFQEFKRFNISRLKQDRGLGLGLAIVDKIARILNHKIGVESFPGRGSVFSVTVPYSELQIDSFSEPNFAAQDLPGYFQQQHVIVVDDDPDICKGMHELLELWGCRVTTAQSMAELKRMLVHSTDHVDMLIVDYQLEDGVVGVDVISLIENLKGKLPVVMITANYSNDLSKQMKKKGYYLINKPVNTMKLKLLMQHLLHK